MSEIQKLRQIFRGFFVAFKSFSFLLEMAFTPLNTDGLVYNSENPRPVSAADVLAPLEIT